jgi:hypothetical protein
MYILTAVTKFNEADGLNEGISIKQKSIFGEQIRINHATKLYVELSENNIELGPVKLALIHNP